MKWKQRPKSEESVNKPQKGAERLVTRFAWLPVEAEDGWVYWLTDVRCVERWVLERSVYDAAYFGGNFYGYQPDPLRGRWKEVKCLGEVSLMPSEELKRRENSD